MANKMPDMIVAVDFGMTATGVAYANLTRSQAVRYIQKWPGRAQANENKVPTVVVYDNVSNGLTSWGFSSQNRLEQNSPNRDYCELFKLFVDPSVLREAQSRDAENNPTSQHEVDRWVEDFLHSLYTHIKFKLRDELPAHSPWDVASIEFIFSVPTTWSPHPTTERFKNMARRAGFGTHANHQLIIGLTEAEAAAVHVAIEASVMFQESDILLTVDAGGGTADLGIMEVTGITRGVPELRQLMEVKGRNIGSAQIDQAFEDLVVQRLNQANGQTPLGIDIEEAAWDMTKSAQWLDNKCCFGSPDDSNFTVIVPGLDRQVTNIGYGIREGSMLFTLADLQDLFDRQISRLFELIDSQLQTFRLRYPAKHVRHLILSGGLGNSAYVQRKLRERYAMFSNSALGSDMLVHVAPEPQLAVCKGLTSDRLRRLQTGKAVLGWRCSRASYGVICRVLHNPNNPAHRNCPTYHDPLNNQLYVLKVCDWFIKKGDPVNMEEPIGYPYSRKIKPGDPTRVFHTDVVVSYIDKETLPYTMNDNVKTLCELKSDLTGADDRKFKMKNRHWWQMGKKKYMRVDYFIKCLVGPADITFELWFDGQKLSKDQPIQVEWKDVEPPKSPGSQPLELGERSHTRASTSDFDRLRSPTPSFANAYSKGYTNGHMGDYQNGYAHSSRNSLVGGYPS